MGAAVGRRFPAFKEAKNPLLSSSQLWGTGRSGRDYGYLTRGAQRLGGREEADGQLSAFSSSNSTVQVAAGIWRVLAGQHISTFGRCVPLDTMGSNPRPKTIGLAKVVKSTRCRCPRITSAAHKPQYRSSSPNVDTWSPSSPSRHELGQPRSSIEARSQRLAGRDLDYCIRNNARELS